jgi:hypothetical protein
MMVFLSAYSGGALFRCSSHDAMAAFSFPCPAARFGTQTVRCSALRLAVAVSGPSSRRSGRRRQSDCTSVPVTGLCPQKRRHPAATAPTVVQCLA